MKKKFIGILVVLCLFVTACVSTDNVPVEYSSETIVEVKNKTSEDIFVLANSWAVDTFRSAESVIEFSDKEAGIIKGSFTAEVGNFWTGVVTTKTTMTIETKDGKARISFTNPMMKYPPETLFVPKGWVECTTDRLEDLNVIWDMVTLDFTEALNQVASEW